MNNSTTNVQSLNTSKPPLGFTTMNSLINETTTNTFNQDSQDTGYQTTSMANCGANGSSSSSSSSSCMHPSLINMDTTHAFRAISQPTAYSLNSRPFSLTSQSNTNNILGSLISRNVLTGSKAEPVNDLANPATTITSTPMSLGDEEFNFNYDIACSNFDNHHHNYLDFYDEDVTAKKTNDFKSKMFDFTKALEKNSAQGPSAASSMSFEFATKSIRHGIMFGQNSVADQSDSTHNKRPLNVEKKNSTQASSGNNVQTANKMKKTSISLNSLQNIHPVGE